MREFKKGFYQNRFAEGEVTSGLMPVIRDNRLSSVLDDCSVFDYEQAMRKNNQQTVAAVVVVTL